MTRVLVHGPPVPYLRQVATLTTLVARMIEDCYARYPDELPRCPARCRCRRCSLWRTERFLEFVEETGHALGTDALRSVNAAAGCYRFDPPFQEIPKQERAR